MTKQSVGKQDELSNPQNEIGARIRQIRGDLSQAEFAAKFSMHKNTLFRIEKGESDPSYTFLQQLVTLEGVSPEWLLLGKGDIFLGTEESIMRIVEETSQRLGKELTYTELHALTDLAKSSLLKKVVALLEALDNG